MAENPQPPVASTVSIAVPPGAPVQPAQSAAPAQTAMPSASTGIPPVPAPPYAPASPAPAQSQQNAALPAGFTLDAAPAPNAPAPQTSAPAPPQTGALPPGFTLDAPAPATPPPPAQSSGYQQAAQPAQGTLASTPVGQAALALANGALLGQGARVAGGIHAAAQYVHNLFTGSQGQPTPGQAYDAYANTTNQDEQQFAAANPVTSTTLNIAGGLPAGGAMGKIIGAVPTVAGKIAAAIGTGAASGAAYGSGANMQNPVMGALIGGGEGALLAPVFMGVGAAGKAALNVVRNTLNPSALEATAQQRAAQYLAQQAANAPVVAPSTVPAANGGLTVAETLGQQGTGMAAALTRKPGIAGDLANDILGQRQAGRTDRLVQGFSDATGVDPNAARGNVEQMIAQGQDSVNPAYNAIRANPAPVMTPDLQDLATNDPHVAAALNAVNNATRNAPPVPTAATWLAVRQQLADNVERNPVTGSPLPSYMNAQINSAAKDLGAAMNDAIPGFSNAQAQAALYKAPQASFNQARGMLFGGTAKQTPADVQDLWDAAQTPSQQQAIQSAFAADFLDRAVNKNTLTPGLVNSPGVQQKLAIVFGPGAASKLSALAQQEQQMSQFAARVIPNGNSVTAEALNYGHEADGLGKAAMEAAPHLLAGPHGIPHAAVTFLKGATNGILSSAKTNGDIAFRNALAQQYLGDASSFTPMPVASTRSIAVAPIMTNAANQGLAQLQGQQ